jgi:DNA-binding NtrC family response regulator
MQKINVLIIEEFKYIADLNVLELRRGGFEVDSRCVCSEEAMRRALIDSKFDIILSDNSTPHFNAIQALFTKNELSPKTPFIIVSEDVSPESIKLAMRNKCCAYLLKENLHQLAILVKNIINSKQL